MAEVVLVLAEELVFDPVELFGDNAFVGAASTAEEGV
jgi:hypothetical protein